MKGRKPASIVTGNMRSVPNPPSWLAKDAKSEWRRVMPDLIERNILTNADLGSLENYCVAVGRIRELEKMLRVGIDPKLFRMQDQAIKTSRQLAAELGLTPVSRSRPSVRNDDQDNDDENPFNVS